MADARTTESQGPAGFGHWHDALYDVLAMVQGAGALVYQDPESVSSVCRILDQAGSRLEKTIEGLDEWQIRFGPDSQAPKA